MNRYLAVMFVLAAGLFVSLTSYSNGAGCVTGVCATKPAVVSVPPVVTSAATIVQATPAVAVTVPVLVPAFSFQFLPALAEPEEKACDCDAILRELAAIKDLLNQSNRDNGPPIVGGTQHQDTVAVVDSSAKLNQAVSYLRNNCASCHTAPSGRGNVTLFDQSSKFAPNVGWDTIWYVVKNDVMPMDKNKKASPEIKQLLLDIAIAENKK